MSFSILQLLIDQPIYKEHSIIYLRVTKELLKRAKFQFNMFNIFIVGAWQIH